MRCIEAVGLAVAITALTASAALAGPGCGGSDVTADSGEITIATGPEPISTPQTPVILPPED